MSKFWRSLIPGLEVPSVSLGGLRPPFQGRCGMAAALVALASLFAMQVAPRPVQAQSSQGLFWQCATNSGQPQYCPVNNTYPLPTTNATTGGGATIYRSVALTSTAVAVDTSPGTVSSISVSNNGGSAVLCYIQLYDVALASVTVGMTVPTVSFAIAPATVVNLAFPVPLQFSTAITAAATTTAGGSTACNPILSSTLIGYK